MKRRQTFSTKYSPIPRAEYFLSSQAAVFSWLMRNSNTTQLRKNKYWSSRESAKKRKKNPTNLRITFRRTHYAVKRATVESFIINDLIYEQHISSLKARTILKGARELNCSAATSFNHKHLKINLSKILNSLYEKRSVHLKKHFK